MVSYLYHSTPPMRILFLTSKLDFATAGGSVDEMDLMMRMFREYGAGVTAVTVFSRLNRIDRSLPYRVVPEQVRSRRLFGIAREAFALFRKYERDADVFFADGHLMLYGAGLYRFLGGKTPVLLFFNRELSAWPQNTSPFFSPPKPSPLRRSKERIRFFIEKRLCMPLVASADAYTFTNPFLEQAYRNFNLRTAGKSYVFCDPYELDVVMRENRIAEETYRKRNKRAGPVTLFYSSRMAPGKGFDLLILAFSKVAHKERFRLILGGAGPEEELIKSKVRELGLESFVEFPGWVTRSELRRNLAKADIFIQARWRQDMTSLSLTEAMAFGLPSIVPEGGGLEWTAGGAALTFTPDDPVDLARAIQRLGEDATFRAKLSAACYRRLHEEEVEYRKTLPKLYRILENLASGKHPLAEPL